MHGRSPGSISLLAFPLPAYFSSPASSASCINFPSSAHISAYGSLAQDPCITLPKDLDPGSSQIFAFILAADLNPSDRLVVHNLACRS